MEGFVFHWGVFTTQSDCLSRGVDGVTPADDKASQVLRPGASHAWHCPAMPDAAGQSDLSQQMPVLFQPLLREPVIRTRRSDLLPESRGVVVFPQVHQLVQDDVVPDIR